MKTFGECINDPVGTVYERIEKYGFLGKVVRGPIALCAYIGVPKENKFYGKDYSLDDAPKLDVHGGLTFSDTGFNDVWEKDYWWFGWDYGHLWDIPFYDLHQDGHGWYPDEVSRELHIAMEELLELSK